MKNRLNEVRKRLRDELQENIDYSRDVSDEEMQELIDGLLIREGKKQALSLEEKAWLRKELFHAVRKLDVLQELIDNAEITEIMINGPESIFVEQKGRLSRLEQKFESKEKLEDIIQQIVAACNRVVNESSPIVDARLESGARVNVVLNPVALNGPIVTIRRFPDRPIMMEDLVAFGSVPSDVCEWLQKLVRARYNIFISGGTGSGKTTFLNALSDYIPKDERIITIEDNAELQILNIPNLVRLETRNANVEGCREITIRDLIRTSLRMRPEGIRIIQGKLKHNKKRFPIPGAFPQHVFGDLIPLICCKAIKII